MCTINGMKSDRKRLIKKVQKFADDEIRSFLGDGDYRLVHNRTLACWFIQAGDAGEMTIDDEVCRLTCVEFMRTHGYPISIEAS